MDTNEQSPSAIPSADKKAAKPLSEEAKAVVKQIETLSSAEEKIKSALEFMRNALSHSGNPRFKDFWDIRTLCLPLFKAPMGQAQRSELWAAYVEISTEAKRLKEILEEQSAFATEQIELAIVAIEKDLAEYDSILKQLPQLQVVEKSGILKERKEFYEAMQRELNLLNALASRVNSLRKEVVKTDMRIKVRAKFFDRLSVLGDKIFPRRKELIKTISDQFILDVEQFANEHFAGAEPSQKGTPYYILREEIKLLQSIAKELTLSTHAFNSTREQLSKCWDQLREWDKKRKEEISKKKHALQGNVVLVQEKIDVFAKQLQEGMAFDAAQMTASEIQTFMRTVSLSRDDVTSLKHQIRELLKPFVDSAKAEEMERFKAREEKELHKKETLSHLQQEMQSLIAHIEDLSLEEIVSKKTSIEERFASENPEKAERMRFDALQRKLKDMIADKKAASILKLPQEGRDALEKLQSALQERLLMRDEIRESLENYRKSLGNSGFDFEKAMEIREMIDNDKERLSKLNVTIQELEDKIDELGG
jgi:DNA repair exonuclease SbcCD ATPase subunit